MVDYPLVFIHVGKQRYLKKVINLAEKSGNKVYLVGDQANKEFCKNWININTLNADKYCQFENIYYHMSTNRIEFELICIKRYFLLLAFMNEMDIETCFMMDSDVCVYSNLEEINLEKYDVACGVVDDDIPNTWCASPHSSFWRRKSLEKFLEYIYELYAQKDPRLEEIWNYHKNHHLYGGISDMVLLRFWLDDRKPVWLNLAKVKEGKVFDDNINYGCNYKGEEYQLRKLFFNRKMKKIIFDNGKAYFMTIENNKVEAVIIHAQGEAKMYISCLAKCRNNIFCYYLTDIYHEVTTWICHVIKK